jgi:hypothetical protein
MLTDTFHPSREVLQTILRVEGSKKSRFGVRRGIQTTTIVKGVMVELERKSRWG